VTPPLFLLDDIPDTPEVFLAGDEGRHAARVQRIKPGETIYVADGAGTLLTCRVRSVVADGLKLAVTERRVESVPEPRLVVVQALPKGDRGELAVETMTEVGVDVIVPWSAAHCVTQWRPDKRDKALGRWRSTAREAAKQARRSWLPEVADLATTAQVADVIAESAAAVILHEEATTALTSLKPPATGDLVVVVGPEGGVAPEEIDRFTEAGAVPALLGPTVLRTSTAGVAAAAVLLAQSGRW
jgi:16S rRNA (uracil1498-N3)-methyltransferase